jgi:hypothetical protein
MEVTGERAIGCHVPCDMDPLLRKRGHVTRRDLSSVTRHIQGNQSLSGRSAEMSRDTSREIAGP